MILSHCLNADLGMCCVKLTFEVLSVLTCQFLSSDNFQIIVKRLFLVLLLMSEAFLTECFVPSAVRKKIHFAAAVWPHMYNF